MKEELNNQISIENARILIFKIDKTVEELFSQLEFPDISEFSKLVSDKRRLEYLGVRIALMNLLGVEKKIVYDRDGKPAFIDKSFHISVSHSGSWIAVVVHPNRQVGIDIEVPTEKIKKLYKRFLNETEQKELSNGENLNQLMLAWSAKEALYKIIGKEAVDFANQLHIFPFETKMEGVFTAEHVSTKQRYNLHYIQNEAYTLVFCVV